MVWNGVQHPPQRMRCATNTSRWEGGGRALTPDRIRGRRTVKAAGPNRGELGNRMEHQRNSAQWQLVLPREVESSKVVYDGSR